MHHTHTHTVHTYKHQAYKGRQFTHLWVHMPCTPCVHRPWVRTDTVHAHAHTVYQLNTTFFFLQKLFINGSRKNEEVRMKAMR
jgi:hypothetical protein